MNFVLVTVDSLRADRVGDGYARNTTPFLDGLADGALFFERAYSPSSHTREAVPSILTGCYPSNAVTRTYRMTEPTVAQILQDAGYETGGFVSGPFFTARKGYEDGFDTFESRTRRAPSRC
jgi:arylsulfatase